MSDVLSLLRGIWKNSSKAFMVTPDGAVKFRDIEDAEGPDLSEINAGDVVCLVGDFDPFSIRTLIELMEKNAIIVPLTKQTLAQHNYFFDVTQPKAIIAEGKLTLFPPVAREKGVLAQLASEGRAGVVLFTSGTTGKPKAILHDFSSFLARFDTPRPALKTLSFLLFDHIGGLNTLFHTLFNRGLIVSPRSRDVGSVLSACIEHQVELLPTTPTFLRMLLMTEYGGRRFPESLRLVTYGTERMDENTLSRLCDLLPEVDFRQTYGMSEIGILRVKTRARDGLWMKVGGEGVETQIVDNVLHIRSQNRMLGYLNAPDPFDGEGWYNTGDLVEVDGEWIKISGRLKDVANVGGLKFNTTEVEDVALQFPGIELARAEAKENPYTGSHVELIIQVAAGATVETSELRAFLSARLAVHKRPVRVSIGTLTVSHRFKKM